MSRREGEVPSFGADSPIQQTLVGYWNLPGLRPSFLSWVYTRAFRQLLADGFCPECVLSYNVYPHSVVIGCEAKRLGIPWVPVVADAPGDLAAYAQMERQLGMAAGCVFLSWNSYSRWKGGPRLHLDGGVADAPEHELDPPPEKAKKIIFYSGVLNEYGGVDLLLDAFALVSEPDARLWICGKGDNGKLREMLQTDSRITFFGFVPEERLRELSRQAWVMVNPRPSSVADNSYNFPSKLLEYLSYCKPVVSTWTPGLSAEYRPFLRVPASETPTELAEAIREVLGWTPDQRSAHLARVAPFLREKRTWQIQACRLLSWLQKNR